MWQGCSTRNTIHFCQLQLEYVQLILLAQRCMFKFEHVTSTCFGISEVMIIYVQLLRVMPVIWTYEFPGETWSQAREHVISMNREE